MDKEIKSVDEIKKIIKDKYNTKVNEGQFLFELKNKYSYFLDNIYQHFEISAILLICLMYSLYIEKNIFLSIIYIIIYLIIVYIKNIIIKKGIENTKLNVYQDRVEYIRPFVRKNKIIYFRDLSDIKVSTTFLRRRQPLFLIKKGDNFLLMNSIVFKNADNAVDFAEKIGKVYDEYVKTHKLYNVN